MVKDSPPLRGSANDIAADPTAKNTFSNQFNGMWPLYAGVVLTKRVERVLFEFGSLETGAETAQRVKLVRTDDLRARVL
jgi:hypothetical protein